MAVNIMTPSSKRSSVGTTAGVGNNTILFSSDLRRIQINELYIQNSIYNVMGSPGLTITNTSGTSPAEMLRFVSTKTPVDGDTHRITFYGPDSSGTQQEYGRLDFIRTDVTDGTEDGQFQFSIMQSGTMTEVMQLRSTAAGAIDTTFEGANDVIISDGSLTITDGDNANTLAITNDTITSSDMVNFNSGSITTGTLQLLTLDTSALITTGRALEVVANAATTSTGIVSVSGTALTDGWDMLLTGGGANATASGGVLDIDAGAATLGSALRVSTSGVYTGATGVVDINAAAATTGDIVVIGGTGLTEGSALRINTTTATLTTGFYIECNDGAASDFTIADHGITTIAGNAAGNNALVLTTGDLRVTSGDFYITVGNATITETTDGNVALTLVADAAVANSMQTISATRDINGTVAGAVALTGYANVLGQASAHQVGDFVVTQTADTAGVLQLNLDQTTTVACTAADIFASTALDVNVTSDVNVGTTDARVTTTARAIDVTYAVSETDGIAILDETDVVRINLDVAAGVDINNAATATGLTMLRLDADGFVPGATVLNATTISGLLVDFSSASVVDPQATVYGVEVRMPVADHSATAATYGIISTVPATSDGALFTTDGTNTATLSDGAAAITAVGPSVLPTIDSTPLTDIDGIDITGTNVTSAALLDLDDTARVSGSGIDYDLTTATITANTVALDILVSSAHDDGAADDIDGVLVTWSGDVPGSNACDISLFRGVYSGELGSAGAIAELRGLEVDFSGSTNTGSIIYGFDINTGTQVMGAGCTLTGGRILVDSAETGNAKTGFDISKDLVNSTAVGALGSTNSALRITSVNASSALASGASTISGNVVHLALTNSAAVAVADVYNNDILHIDYSADTTGTGTATTSVDGIVIDYNIAETGFAGGSVTTVNAFNGISVDFDTANTPTYGNVDVSLINVNGTDAGVPVYDVGGTGFNGMLVDLSGMDVSDANLTLYALNASVPAFSASTQAAGRFTDTEATVLIADGTSGLNITVDADTVAMTIDAGTTNHAADGNIISMNIDVEGNFAVNGIAMTFDYEATGMAAADISKGMVVDFNEVVAHADTSGVYGYDFIETGFATSRNDVIGFRGYFDGSHTGADDVTGLLVDVSTGTMVLNTATFRGVYVDGSAYTHTDGNFYGVDINASTAVTAGTQRGLMITSGANTTSIYIDNATTDRAVGDVIYGDIDVNAAAVNFIHADLDVGTALTADVCRGVFIDIDDIAASTDTSALVGFDTTITAVSTSRSDIIGYRVTLDGQQDESDTITGMLVDGSGLTVVTGVGTPTALHGIEIAFAGVTDTNYGTGEFNALDITMPAVYQGTDVASGIKVTGAGAQVDILSGAATIYGVDLTLAADTVGIFIDADVTDHTAGNIIDVDLGVNSASVNVFNANIDIGTLLTAGEVVRGIYIDANELVVNETGSQIIGSEFQMTATSTSINDLIGYEVNFDGTKDTTADVWGVHVNADSFTIDDSAATFVGLFIDASAATNTDSVSFYGVNSIIPTQVGIPRTRAAGRFTDGTHTMTTGDGSMGISATGINEELYYWCDDFDYCENAATLDAHQVDYNVRWTVGGTTHAAANQVLRVVNNGNIELTTNGAANDSEVITNVNPIRVDSNPIFEVRFETDSIAANTNVVYVGLTETATPLANANFEAVTDDFILVGIDTGEANPANIRLVTDDTGAAAQTGLIEDLGVAVSASTYCTVRVDCTDTEQPRVWVNNTGGPITPADEIAAALITGTIQAGISMYPVIFVEGLAVATSELTVDYFKIWSNRG